MKVKAEIPRHLSKQAAWYYLPYGTEKTVNIYSDKKNLLGPVVVKISAKKLLRELLAAGVKP